MQLTTSSFEDGGRIPGGYAFCVPDPATHVTLGANRNPSLAWTDLPTGTRSLAVICHDPVVPTVGDDVNQEGREVPPDLPRTDFYHWVLIDLAPEPAAIAEGEFSDGVTARGKEGPAGPRGTRQGLNDYTGWFAGDADMAGSYYGYDGPCPPWNDPLVHEYHFTLYALDVDRLDIDGDFTGAAVLAAMQAHVLDQAAVSGTYTLNAKLLA